MLLSLLQLNLGVTARVDWLQSTQVPVLQAQPGAFVLTGNSATLTVGSAAVTARVSWLQSTQVVATVTARVSWLQGQEAAGVYVLQCLPGSFVLSVAGSTSEQVLQAGRGVYALAGRAALLAWSGEGVVIKARARLVESNVATSTRSPNLARAVRPTNLSRS